MSNDRIYKGIILNDYEGAPYATWIMTRKKTIETRMGRLFKYRGDIIICCGSTNSVSNNAGKALCLVNIYDGRAMIKEDEEAACIEWHPNRKSLLLKDWRYFNKTWEFRHYKVAGPWQGIFDLRLPNQIEILSTFPTPQP